MDKKVVLIIGRRGEVRDGIEALVKAITEVGEVICFEDVSLRSEQITRLKPDLVIFDSSQMEEDYRRRLRLLRRLLPLTMILALVEGEVQKRVSRECGADSVLVKGFRSDLLIRTVRRLVKGRNDKESRFSK
ncbi:response regulator transcription factor [Candidatus Bipolaricaulota bacterium]|nr:response regulator transcription factor [Candidatus Bipolaricaulota bacterium]